MRVLRQLGVVQDTDLVKFPDGQIQNENEDTGLEGTPVVREVYGDVLSNIYAIMRDAGVTANGNEDNTVIGYQLLEAFKKFSNETNDIEQVLSVSGLNVSVQLDISVLPNNFVFVGKLSDALNSGVNYTFNSSLNLTVSKNINASANVICILDETGVRLIDLTDLESVSNVLYTTLGTPLSYNDSATVYYLSNGIIMSDLPSSYDVQDSIRNSINDQTIIVIDAVVLNGKLLVNYVKNPLLDSAHVAVFDLTDLNTVTSDVAIDVGVNQYMYCDGSFIYFTNHNNGNDYDFSKYSFDGDVLSLVSTFSVDSNFTKTTNLFIKGGLLYTLISSVLRSYPLNGGNSTVIGSYPTTNGVVFSHNGNIYYSNGNVASKWSF